MRIIGLTGSIACGKSTVSGWLKQQPGCRVIDGDQMARRLTERGGSALELIRGAFGDGVFQTDGELNRRKLGSLIFSDQHARGTLDSLMAPLLEQETRNEIHKAQNDRILLCFLDYPLLFEKGYDSLCDSVWCVYLPRPLQLHRLMVRDGLSEPEASARVDAVLSSEDKAARSAVVIDNSGSLSDTLGQLPPLLQKEMEKAKAESSDDSPSPRRRRSVRNQEVVKSTPVSSETVSSPLRSLPHRRPTSEAVPMSRADAYSSQTALQASPVPGQGLPSDYMSGSVTPATQSAAPASSSFLSESLISEPNQSAKSEGIDRPRSSRRRPSERKAGWRMPVWLVSLLTVSALLLLSGVTAQILMRAYLTRQAEQHQADADEVLYEYRYDDLCQFSEIITEAAAEFNLRPAFVTAIIRTESSFQPRVESGVGARGLMQLMPDTAEWIAGKMKLSGYAFDRMYDPESNVRFGCWYLNYLAGLFHGDPVSVACAYHAGQGQVTAWLSDSSLTADGVRLNLDRLADGPTKSYARKVIKAYGIYQALYFDGADPYHVLLPVFGQ